MSIAILFTTNVIWAIYERSQGQSISDQVLFTAIFVLVYVFRGRKL